MPLRTMNAGDERGDLSRRMSWLSPLAIRFTHAEISSATWQEQSQPNLGQHVCCP